MANLNRAQFIGRLTRDPELKTLKQGSLVANFAVATTRTYGEDQKDTLFIDVVAWNKQAEKIGEFLVKGQEIFCEGHLELDQWKSKDQCGDPNCGHEKIVKRQKLRLVLEQWQFLGPLKKDSLPSSDSETSSDRRFERPRRDDRSQRWD